MIVDEDKVGRVPTTRAVKVPITQLAVEATGKAITANVVALGVLVGLTQVVSRDAIEKAVTARAPKGTEEMNRAALAAGFAAAEQWRGRQAAKAAATGLNRQTLCQTTSNPFSIPYENKNGLMPVRRTLRLRLKSAMARFA